MAEKDSEYSDHKPFITVKSEDGTENTYYSILCEDLPEELLQKAKQEVNETEENKRKGLRKLKEYMQKEKLPYTEDEFVIAVLRNCKYDIKKSKVKLAKFIKVHEMIKSKMAKFTIDDVDALLGEKGFGIFPYRDKEGRIITFCQPFLQIFSYDLELLEAGFVAAIVFLLTLPHMSLLGACIVMESEVPEMRYFYPLIKILIHLFPCMLHMPHRVGSVKILNENSFGRLIYRVACPFLPDKISKRVCFVGRGFEELHKDYPPEIMPEEFGVYLGPMNAEVYKQRMMDRLKYAMEKMKCS